MIRPVRSPEQERGRRGVRSERRNNAQDTQQHEGGKTSQNLAVLL